MTPDEIRSKVVVLLSKSHPGEDVKVDVGNVPYGLFVWEEGDHKHVPLKTGDLFKSLGFSPDVRDWAHSLPIVALELSALKAS